MHVPRKKLQVGIKYSNTRPDKNHKGKSAQQYVKMP